MALDDYQRMCSFENLKRAYRWTQSNPDAVYKGYFRDCYAAYAASSEHNLRRLRKHLVRGAYEPGHASKVYLPKPSGILRPYTLLTVNDQIVYQACVNIIADKLRPKIRQRYLKTIFGHLYAGRASRFFYIKWQTGYRAYTDAVTRNITSGFTYVANFDLAAFYDSIDHNVLKHFLRELAIELDLIDFLLGCLELWTSSTWTNQSSVIYHGHGIPQGPLASGLLSEVVLKHIDDRGVRAGSIRYLRYVDDIKLFAKKESVLRQRLVGLDLAAKEIGLFPQSAKINIRQTKNPKDEIKTVSNPPETSLVPVVNQDKVRARVLELTRRGKVQSDDLTRFKYVIGRAAPDYRLDRRLISLLKHHPAMCAQIGTYFSRYTKLPKRTSVLIVDYLQGDEVYHAAHAAILLATLDNMRDPYRKQCIELCYKRLLSAKRGTALPQPTYKAAMLAWLLRWDRLTHREIHKIYSDEVDWWVMKDSLKYLRKDQYGPATYEHMLNDMIKGYTEPARVAALKMVDDDVTVHNHFVNAKESARLLLYAAGKTRRVGQPESLVGLVLTYVLTHKFAPFDWQKLAGPKHDGWEHIAFTVKRHFESDINACIVTLDSLCDAIWERIFAKEVTGKMYGQYGHMLKHPALVAKYPAASGGFTDLHQLRLESVTAHPRTKAGLSTRRLKHHDFYRIRSGVRAAIEEIIHVT